MVLKRSKDLECKIEEIAKSSTLLNAVSKTEQGRRTCEITIGIGSWCLRSRTRCVGDVMKPPKQDNSNTFISVQTSSKGIKGAQGQAQPAVRIYVVLSALSLLSTAA